MTPHNIARKLVNDHFAIHGHSLGEEELVTAIAALLTSMTPNGWQWGDREWDRPRADLGEVA